MPTSKLKEEMCKFYFGRSKVYFSIVCIRLINNFTNVCVVYIADSIYDGVMFGSNITLLLKTLL